jgi:DNA invertase Pin-like site-specific DNA recombinase
MMTIMDGIEFKPGLIRSRCEEGIQKAKAKGTQFGRPTPGERRKVADRYVAGETTSSTFGPAATQGAKKKTARKGAL